MPATIEIFCDYHTPTVFFARNDQGDWWIIPATRDGWPNRRQWSPAPLTAAKLATDANRVSFYGSPWLAEVSLGIPRDLVVAA